jgi:hypothetical protein
MSQNGNGLGLLSVCELVLGRELAGCANFWFHQKGVKGCVVLLCGQKVWELLKVTAV